jgi:hypothetical protein
MDFGPGSGGPRDVAVGPTRDVAAAVFGAQFDSALITSYDAFDADVDLSEVASLGAVAGPGLADLLNRLERDGAGLWPERVLLGLPADLAGRDALVSALAGHPSVAVSGLSESRRGVVVSLGHAGQVPAEDHARYVEELRTRMPSAPAAADQTNVLPAPTPARRRMPDLLATPQRRRLAAQAGAIVLVAAILVAAVLVAIGQSELGAHGVLVTVVLATALAQCVVALGVLYAVRLARHTRAAQQELHRQLLARTDQLVRLSKNAVGKDKEILRDLEQLHREVAALGRLQARGRIEERERP